MAQGLSNFYRDESMQASFEIWEGRAFLHCNVYKWNAKTLRTCYRVLGQMLDKFTEMNLEAAYTISPNPKFCELMGGRYCSDIMYEDKPYGVYKWELK